MIWRGALSCARHGEAFRAPATEAPEFVALFSTICPKAHSDENAVAAIARQRGGVLITTDIVRRLLPIPGKTVTGGQIRTALGDNAVLESEGVETGLPNSNYLRTPACTLVTTGPGPMDPLPGRHSNNNMRSTRTSP